MTPDWNSMQVLRYTDKGDETAAMKKGPDGFIIAEFVDGSIETLDAANLMMDVVSERKKKDAETKKKQLLQQWFQLQLLLQQFQLQQQMKVRQFQKQWLLWLPRLILWICGQKESRPGCMCIGACICK